MANVLTDLAADLYTAADVVGRELTGITSSSTINGNDAERAALGGTVRSFFTREVVAIDTAPSMTIPEGTDQTVDNKTMTISKSRAVQIPWRGEEIKSVNNGSGWSSIYGDQLQQAMRTLANEMEVDLGVAAYQAASRSVGTAGTVPFASSFDHIAESRQILVDNGCPIDQLSLVLNTTAGTNLRNLANLQKVNEAGSDSLLRQGTLLDLQGMALKESAGIASHTSSARTGTLINGASVAIGDKAIPVDTGSGVLVIGDNITIAGDTNVYVVAAATAALITLNTGLLVAPADNASTTIKQYW